MSTLEFRKVDVADREALQALYTGAAIWIREVKGVIGQWGRSVPASEIDALIETGEAYAACRGGEIVAAVRAARDADFLWKGREAPAIYIHSLAVRRDLAGQGIGRKVLAWARVLANTEGRQFLRLDCMASNPELRRYYMEAGFTDLGVHPLHPWHALFELMVG